MRAAQVFAGLSADALRHPDDRRAAEALRSMPGIEWAQGQLRKNRYPELARAILMANAVQAGPAAYPTLAEIVRDAAAALETPVPDVFVAADQHPAYRILGGHHPAVAIDAELLSRLDEEEALALAGMCVAHHKSAHAPLLMLAEFLRAFASHLGAGANVLLGALLALEEWRLYAGYTADRGALLVTGDGGATPRLLARMAGARQTAFGEVSPEALAAQAGALAEEGGIRRGGLLERLALYGGPERAFTVLRADELRRWSESAHRKAFAAGDYAREDAGAADGSGASPWRFVPEGFGPWGQAAEGGGAPGGDASAGYGRATFDDLRTAATGAAGKIQQGAEALGKAASAFLRTFAAEMGKPEEDAPRP